MLCMQYSARSKVTIVRANTDQLEVLERAFFMPNLIGYWPDIQQRYKMMGFTDQLTDKEKIEEYDYITKQLNKYLSAHHDEVLSKCDSDLSMMLGVIKNLLDKAPTVTKDRKSLVYMAMRDDWLIGMYNLLEGMISQVDKRKTSEEVSDDWNE